MSSILYYSKYCEICKKYIQILSKTDLQQDIHFICIDRRVKEHNKTYILLENGQKIILPDNVTKVPALLLLNQGYRVLYGEEILNYLKPRQREEVRHATKNNMEPAEYSLEGSGGFYGDVVSDKYSFLDQDPSDLSAEGNGGMRQLHNYMDVDTAFKGHIDNYDVSDDHNTTIRGAKKMGEDKANSEMERRMKQLQEERDADMRAIKANRPPMF